RGKLIGAYSTGMKRRGENARAVMGDPKGLFLDEPTPGPDLPAKREKWQLFGGLSVGGKGATFPRKPRAPERRAPFSENTGIASGRLVYTGAARDLGDDLDAFEDRLVELLTHEKKRPGLFLQKP